MLGETVVVLTRMQDGTDTMDEPTYTWKPEAVENVLVRPLAGTNLADEKRPDGVTVHYSLAFPKTWTAGKKLGFLTHARVVLVARGMDPSNPNDALRVSGSPDRTVPCPTAWDCMCEVGRVDG